MTSGINLTGTLMEAGRLEGELGQSGIRMAREDGTFLTIRGLTEAETQALAGMFLDVIAVSVERAK